MSGKDAISSGKDTIASACAHVGILESVTGHFSSFFFAHCVECWEKKTLTEKTVGAMRRKQKQKTTFQE